jgi:hypothetical protein
MDRGLLGSGKLVRFRYTGGRVLVEQVNLGYRSSSDNLLERRAVAESFSTSVLWSGAVERRTEAGRLRVDFTSFLLRDANGIARTLKRMGEGTYKVDLERSVADLSACESFPDNLILESVLTFSGEPEGRHLASVVPDPSSITVVQYQTLVRLPDDGYVPRRYDLRAGSFAIDFQDFSAPLGSDWTTRRIVRHRVTKNEPLVYYVDRSVPEPIRSALVEGASWWAEAFEAAGFPGMYQVKLLPADVHPMDARYNVIEWVHRSTRGWSWGGGIIDPRSGEMIKAHVRLGSLRVRQDRLLFEGLLGADGTGRGGANDPVQLALARIRQLAAHEVGHTLGLNHNFAASTIGRASVMDYPAPLVKVTGDRELDLSEAYTVGIGAWDINSIRYAYTEFKSAAAEKSGLAAILAEGRSRGLVYLTDADARPSGAAHPAASLWDNGADAVTALRELMEVRRIALARFGPDRVGKGEPLAKLEEVLAPVYFMHRYQVTAAMKLVGGLEYEYALREAGDESTKVAPVDATRQEIALDAVLAALDPAVLDLPEAVLRILAPRPAGYGMNREMFTGGSRPGFDPVAAAGTAARLVLDGLLDPARGMRLIDQHRRDRSYPGLAGTLAMLENHTFPRKAQDRVRLRELQRAVQTQVVGGLIRMATATGVPAPVRSRASYRLRTLRDRLESETPPDAVDGRSSGHREYLVRWIDRILAGEDHPEMSSPAPGPPPGSPIGMPGGGSGCSFSSI